MEFATLNNGVKMPMAGIGTFLLSPDEAEASVLSALECGYRLIDTANAYVNEKAVGRAMKKSGVPREEIFLETKLWPSFYEQEDAVEKTLERLDTDYIDYGQRKFFLVVVVGCYLEIRNRCRCFIDIWQIVIFTLVSRVYFSVAFKVTDFVRVNIARIVSVCCRRNVAV